MPTSLRTRLLPSFSADQSLEQSGRLRRKVGERECFFAQSAPLRNFGGGDPSAVFWFKTGTFALTIESIIAFVIFGLFDAARARSDWNTFESIYPDIGIEHDSAGR
jgi:hypothetical protein